MFDIFLLLSVLVCVFDSECIGFGIAFGVCKYVCVYVLTCLCCVSVWLLLYVCIFV